MVASNLLLASGPGPQVVATCFRLQFYFHGLVVILVFLTHGQRRIQNFCLRVANPSKQLDFGNKYMISLRVLGVDERFLCGF